ncbi:ABC transporter permease [Vibrio gallaecicus]|uniref:ABC transporter permease n=1 Tax=Vibrio gallaecicus TaxID=552386 RepID=A0ABV4N6B1_9VIBR
MNLTKPQWFGLIILTTLLSVVILERTFYQGDIATQNLDLAFTTPSAEEPLGRDHFGRSNLARLSHAITTSLSMALVSITTAALLGTSMGVIAGWKQGWWDRIFSFNVNMILAMPGLILVLLFAAMVPGSFLILYIAISLMLWVDFFRVSRNRTLSLIQSPAVEASRLYGFNHWYIFKRHLWPDCRNDLFTLFCFGTGNSILALASLGFLHVGLKPPEAELGLMMVELFRYYHQAPWVLLQPVLTVFLLVLSFHLLAQGKRHTQSSKNHSHNEPRPKQEKSQAGKQTDKGVNV